MSRLRETVTSRPPTSQALRHVCFQRRFPAFESGIGRMWLSWTVCRRPRGRTRRSRCVSSIYLPTRRCSSTPSCEEDVTSPTSLSSDNGSCDSSCRRRSPVGGVTRSTPSVLFMNLCKRNFAWVVVLLGNYYPVVNIDMLCYSCSIYVFVKL